MGVEAIDIESTTADAGQAIVDVEGASVNRHDLLYLERDFRLQKRHVPFVSGVGVKGTIRESVDDVDGLQLGDSCGLL